MNVGLAQLEICGRLVHLGDYVIVEYTSGVRIKGSRIKGRIKKLWSLEHGDGVKQAQLDSGWCFHEGDKIITHSD